jgi:hypothetical protein
MFKFIDAYDLFFAIQKHHFSSHHTHFHSSSFLDAQMKNSFADCH